MTDKVKCSFFQAAIVSILLYGCTTWTLTKQLEKKLDSNYTRMLQAILKQQLYGHLLPIMKTIQIRWTRHAGHCWSRNKLISEILFWTPSHGRAKAGQPARTYIKQLCEDTGCSPKNLLEAMNDRERRRERVRDMCRWHDMMMRQEHLNCTLVLKWSKTQTVIVNFFCFFQFA